MKALRYKEELVKLRKEQHEYFDLVWILRTVLLITPIVKHNQYINTEKDTIATTMGLQINRNSKKKTLWEEQKMLHNPRTVSTQIIVEIPKTLPSGRKKHKHTFTPEPRSVIYVINIQVILREVVHTAKNVCFGFNRRCQFDLHKPSDISHSNSHSRHSTDTQLVVFPFLWEKAVQLYCQ